MEKCGRYPVAIVGTGPGDTELLSVKADRIIRDATVILYDCKTAASALSLASASALIRYVDRNPDKENSGSKDTVTMLNLIEEYYRKGERVVRLRVGDPMLFGGEVDECKALCGMNLPFEVIPGITAGSAASCSYALPISTKYHSNAVTYLIADEIANGFDEIRDTAKLLKHGSTIVLYMAGPNLDKILTVFQEAGAPGTMPVVAVGKVGWPDEAFVVSTIDSVAVAARKEGLKEPIAYFIGRHLEVRNKPMQPDRQAASCQVNQ